MPQFENIGEMWLSNDHYKWRLMRVSGIEERYITGNAPWPEKFAKYAEAHAYIAKNSLTHIS